MYGKLYVVATPIGNLDDMTFRAVKTLSDVNLIAAEDTRVSRVLLARFDIKTPMISHHQFNEAEKQDVFLSALREGKDVALISDAGTPCISDPGQRLIDKAASAGVDIIGVCGACAAVTAVSVSGFDAATFLYLGFLPRAPKEAAEVLLGRQSPLKVFYESPLRVQKTVALLTDICPDARLCLCNDLTKKFERIYRGSPAQVLAELSENPRAKKGEYVCVMENRNAPPAPPPEEAAQAVSLEARLTDIMVKSGVTLKEAVGILAGQEDGVTKKEVYAASLRLKGLWG